MHSKGRSEAPCILVCLHANDQLLQERLCMLGDVASETVPLNIPPLG